jgi:hypothetical protein
MIRDDSGHPHRALVVDLERDEIPLVDPDQGRVGRERMGEFILVVDLDEDVEADIGGECMEPDQLGAVRAPPRSAAGSRRP